MNRRAIPAVLFALSAVVATCLATAVSTSAAPSTALVRITYLSPNGPNADFYVDGHRVWSNIIYETTSTYAAIAMGSHDFVVRPAGSGPAGTPIAEVQQTLGAGYYSVFAGGRAGQEQAVVFQDGFSNPGAGKFAARFVHMAPEVPQVNVELMDGTVLFSDIGFLQGSSYAAFPTGTYPVQLVDSITGTTLFQTTADVETAGTVYTLVGTGGDGKKVELLKIPDASSAAVAPRGGAATGAGGTAGVGALSLALLACGLLGPAALLLGVRRRRTVA
ncbi:MAG TPA: DUF4397 domain-containing protein [Candidatus Dormibacteraeota bacterium]|nr:DUF4397 domain-containing protein [Candidatus Dormibacteraeota bacterium]